MTSPERIFGLVLAGGRSRRFGREKAMASFRGEPLLAWSLRALGPPVEQVAVSARPGSGAAANAEALGLTWLADGGVMDEGPLAGVLEGLRWAEERGADWLATAPCDAPLLPEEMVTRLAEARTEGGGLACTSEGFQPLCALWPIAALRRLEGQSDHPAIRSVLQTLGASEVAFEDAKAFANLNTPAEFAAAERRAASLGLRLRPRSSPW